MAAKTWRKMRLVVAIKPGVWRQDSGISVGYPIHTIWVGLLHPPRKTIWNDCNAYQWDAFYNSSTVHERRVLIDGLID